MADNNPNVILRKKAYEPGTDSTSGVITFDTNEKKIYLDSDVYGEQNVQADWNQNDSTAPDYIKNRTHWEDDPVVTNHDMMNNSDVLVSSSTQHGVREICIADADNPTDWGDSTLNFVLGYPQLVVSVNGHEFTVQANNDSDATTGSFGIYDIYGIYQEGTEDSGYVLENDMCYADRTLGTDGNDYYQYINIYVPDSVIGTGLNSVIIKTTQSGVHQIPEKFIPYKQADWEQEDTTAPDYIKNKPEIPDGIDKINEYGYIKNGGLYLSDNVVDSMSWDTSGYTSRHFFLYIPESTTLNATYHDIYYLSGIYSENEFENSNPITFTPGIYRCRLNDGDLEYENVSGGVMTIGSLADVAIGTLADGQVLQYDGTSGKWVNAENSGGVQSDWNQSIGTAPDYIKNRTHWKEETEKSLFVSATVMMAGSEDGCSYMSSSDPLSQLKEGSAYTFDVYFPYDDDGEIYLAHKRYVGVKSADARETVGVDGVAWRDASGFMYIRGDMNGDGETEVFAIQIIDNEFASYFQQGGEALIEVSEFFLDTDLYTLSQLSQQQGSGVYSFNVREYENDIEIHLTDSYGIGLLSEGNAYKLKVGENEYIGTASDAFAYTGVPTWFIGNPSAFGGQDNGEVFTVISEDVTGVPNAPFTKALLIHIPLSGADYTSSTGSTAISLYLGRHYLYHKLDNGYLDLSDVAFSGSYSDLSGKPESVTDFPDVVISTITDGDVLKYNSETGKWENGIGSGGTSIQVRVWSSDGN